MDQHLNAAIGESNYYFLETYTLALQYADNADDYAKKILNMFEETLKVREEAKRYDLALEKSKEQSTLEEFENEYQNQLQKTAKKYQLRKTKEFKDFEEELKKIKIAYDSVNNEAETSPQQTHRVLNDGMEMEMEINVIDPLTKRRMENPVKNTRCGHHYEEAAINEAISINPRLRCPVAGCGNKVFVKKQHLVRDANFEKVLSQMARTEDDDADNALM